MRALFILKKNSTYSFTHYCRRSSGLWNSTKFIVDGLKSSGIHAEIIEVIDANDIDREVTNFNPDLVVIEALWVTPTKMKEIIGLRRHNLRRFAVHMHSGLPFLALEGCAVEWILEYARLGVEIIANSRETTDAYRTIVCDERVVFLPNVYPTKFDKPVCRKIKSHIDIGCFGAIRPMKNQLAQAIAAIEFANLKGKLLRFHINGSRIETGGDPALKNLRKLFEKSKVHTLVEHPWMEPEDFIKFLHENIDISLQVSMSETFNVVTADAVAAGIPIVVSKEVAWASRFSQAKVGDVSDIVSKMNRSWKFRHFVRWNQFLLRRHSCVALEMWNLWVRDDYAL